MGAIQYEVLCKRKIKRESATSSYHIVRHSQEQTKRQLDPPLSSPGTMKFAFKHLQWRPGQSSWRPPHFSVRYCVTPICLSVGREVYHAQHICSIMQHLSSSEMPFNSTNPSLALRSSQTCTALASWFGGSAAAGSHTYVLWGSVICWRLDSGSVTSWGACYKVTCLKPN